MRIKKNGNGDLDAKIGWGEIAKVSGIAAVVITLCITGLSYIGLSPSSSLEIESRLTRTEANLETLARMVNTYIVSDQASTAIQNSRLASIESNRFTVQDGLQIRTELAKLQEYVAHLPSEAWRERIRRIELFLAREFPETFDTGR